MPTRVRTVSEPAEFLRLAGPLLMRDEARNNLLLGLAETLRSEPAVYADHRLWVAEADREVVGAALQTPPHQLVLASPSGETAIEALAGGIDVDLPGVVSARPDAESFAAHWTARTGLTAEVHVRQGLYRLVRVQKVDRSPGSMRRADGNDEALVRTWWRAFAIEALGDQDPDETVINEMVAHRVGRGSIALWQTDGETVALAGLQGKTPNGIRIGPVYTPPHRRGRGYATSLVAELSTEALAAGNQFCMLYTNLANATSNRIYQRIGYELLCESAEIGFVA